MVKDHLDSKRRNPLPPLYWLVFSFRLAVRGLLYPQSHKEESTHHGSCYTSRGTPGGTRNSSRIYHKGSIQVYCTISKCSYHRATSRSYQHWNLYSTHFINAPLAGYTWCYLYMGYITVILALQVLVIYFVIYFSFYLFSLTYYKIQFMFCNRFFFLFTVNAKTHYWKLRLKHNAKLNMVFNKQLTWSKVKVSFEFTKTIVEGWSSPLSSLEVSVSILLFAWKIWWYHLYIFSH